MNLGLSKQYAAKKFQKTIDQGACTRTELLINQLLPPPTHTTNPRPSLTS